MKKVKSFAKHPAIIIPVIMALLYFSWKKEVEASCFYCNRLNGDIYDCSSVRSCASYFIWT